jgi:hypothetical protein
MITFLDRRSCCVHIDALSAQAPISSCWWLRRTMVKYLKQRGDRAKQAAWHDYRGDE